MTSTQRNEWKQFGIGASFLLVLSLVIYWPMLHGSFIMDDHRLVDADNPLVNGQLKPSTLWFQTDFPLSTLGFYWQWNAFGENSTGYHVVNMVLHGFGAILLWRVLKALHVRGAWFAGALFVAHPVCVNSVARISEFKNTLSLPFFLLSILFFIPFIIDERRSSSGRYVFSFVAFLLAALSKTSTVMLPMVLLLSIRWKRKRVTPSDVLRLLPFFAIALAFGWMSSWFQRHQAMTGSPVLPESTSFRLMNAAQTSWFYLGKAVFPMHLNLVYPPWKAGWLALAALLIVFVLLWLLRRVGMRSALFAFTLYLILLFPVLGLFDSQFLTKWRVSDHLQYLPLIVPVAFFSSLVASLLPWLLADGVLLVIIVFFGLLATSRARIFTNEETLFRDTLAKNSSAWGIQSDLGAILANRKDYMHAEELFRASLDVNPNNPEAASNLGRLLVEQGKLTDARHLFDSALVSDPNHLETYRRLSELDLREGKLLEAKKHLRILIALSPKPELQARLQYANILHATGDFRQSATVLEHILDQHADSVEALNNLAWLLATAPDDSLRDGKRAVAYAMRASQLPAPPQICVPGTLAAALAEAGRFPEAIQTAKEAIRDEQAKGQTQFAAMNQQLMKFYEAGQAFREPLPAR